MPKQKRAFEDHSRNWRARLVKMGGTNYLHLLGYATPADVGAAIRRVLKNRNLL